MLSIINRANIVAPLGHSIIGAHVVYYEGVLRIVYRYDDRPISSKDPDSRSIPLGRNGNNMPFRRYSTGQSMNPGVIPRGTTPLRSLPLGPVVG